MNVTRLRGMALAFGVGLMLVGAIPILLMVGAFAYGPMLLWLLGAFLTAPLIKMVKLGAMVVAAAWNAKPVMAFGRQWSAPGSETTSTPDDVVDVEFER